MHFTGTNMVAHMNSVSQISNYSYLCVNILLIYIFMITICTYLLVCFKGTTFLIMSEYKIILYYKKVKSN